MADPAPTSPPDAAPMPPPPVPRRQLAIIPAFNEGASVRSVVTRLRRTLPEFDVLVIDDGSTDDTVRQVPAGTAVVTLPFNLGIGGAMQTGYRYAALHGYEVAVQVDGDGQHRPSEVRRLVEELDRAGVDLVVGSRFLEPSPRYRQSVPRLAGSWFLRRLIWTLTGMPITDCTSGFRAANRRVIRAFAHWYPEDYPEPEVILLLHRAGFRIGELPVRMRRRRGGRTSINVVAGLFYVLKVTVCLLLDLMREPWPHGRIGDTGTGTSAGGGGVPRDATASTAPPSPARPRRGENYVRGGRRDVRHDAPQPVPGGVRWDPPAAGR